MARVLQQRHQFLEVVGSTKTHRQSRQEGFQEFLGRLLAMKTEGGIGHAAQGRDRVEQRFVFGGFFRNNRASSRCFIDHTPPLIGFKIDSAGRAPPVVEFPLTDNQQIHGQK